MSDSFRRVLEPSRTSRMYSKVMNLSEGRRKFLRVMESSVVLFVAEDHLKVLLGPDGGLQSVFGDRCSPEVHH